MTRRRFVKKRYYSIGDVSRLAGLKPHVLRYWESQFQELSPSRNRRGDRVYLQAQVETVLIIRDLLHVRKFTIKGAKREFQRMKEDAELRETARRTMEAALIRDVERELEEIHELLRPKTP